VSDILDESAHIRVTGLRLHRHELELVSIDTESVGAMEP